MSLIALASILVAVLIWPGGSLLAQPSNPDSVEQAIQAQGAARVVVALRLPYAATAVSERKVQVAQVQARVIQPLAATTDFQLVQRYQTVPGLVGVVTTQGLEELRRQPDVLAVALDLPVYASDNESATLIRADHVWNELGLSGAGVNVAVLDTGIDRTHPDLADHIMAQHCFNQGACPPGGANESEDAQDENGHGTHVAGIVTSRGTTSPRGIASGAGIVAVRVLDKNAAGWNSDVVAGIDWIVANQARLNVRVINMSLGAGRYSDACDAQDANAILLASALNAARQAGITAFAASGNEGQANALSLPACISSVVSVGATYDANLGSLTWPPCSDATATVDQVACFSNGSPALDLLAPGATILSTALGGGQIVKSGTSMASPHAAAVAALMLQAYPGLSPTETETVLKKTGVAVPDRRNGRITPRIDALAAVTRVISDHVSAAIDVLPSNLTLAVGGVATTTVQVDAVRDLYSVDLRLTFDPNVAQVVDADPNAPGVQIAVGTLMRGRDSVVTHNLVDNSAGVIEFVATLRGSAPPISGTGAIAVITWQGRGAGQSALAFQRSGLTRTGGSVIPHNVRNGVIRAQNVAISGAVLLQGREDHSKTLVYLAVQPCQPAPQFSLSPPAGAPSALTDAQGRFTIPITLGSSYSCLRALRAGYLIGQKQNSQDSLGTITLPGGDVNGDDAVNIFDLTLVASHYGTNDTAMDVNGDGVVNIFDLTMVAANLGRAGPVADWR